MRRPAGRRKIAGHIPCNRDSGRTRPDRLRERSISLSCAKLAPNLKLSKRRTYDDGPRYNLSKDSADGGAYAEGDTGARGAPLVVRAE
jgi:hypothetical protein